MNNYVMQSANERKARMILNCPMMEFKILSNRLQRYEERIYLTDKECESISINYPYSIEDIKKFFR